MCVWVEGVYVCDFLFVSLSESACVCVCVCGGVCGFVCVDLFMALMSDRE